MRYAEFKSELAKLKCDFAVFLNVDSTKADSNLFYFTGFEGIGALVVPRAKKPFLIVPAMEQERARRSGVKVYSIKKKKRLFESVLELVKKNSLKAKTIGIDKGSVTLTVYRAFKDYFKGTKVKDISSVCFKLRQIKTEDELAKIRKACSISDKILEKFIASFKKFKTEAEAAAFLEYETKKLGCDIAFKPIVASGSASSMPHHTPQNINIRKGFCVVDFGVKYEGYCSDTTRTLFVGVPSKHEKEMYEMLLRIQEDAVKSIRINMGCGELFDLVNKGLGKYSKNFVHGLGHGLGVDIHEFPNLKQDSKDILKKRMAFTIEPGVYFDGKFGIRIEDTVCIDKKAERLTKITKKMVMIK